jgi:hypothetical protein
MKRRAMVVLTLSLLAGSFPRVVAAGTRVSGRAVDLAGHDVQVRVSWSDAL